MVDIYFAPDGGRWRLLVGDEVVREGDRFISLDDREIGQDEIIMRQRLADIFAFDNGHVYFTIGSPVSACQNRHCFYLVYRREDLVTTEEQFRAIKPHGHY